jgi:hypothetical protein
VEIYSGEYSYNFEYAYLAPDGLNEQWCLKGDMSEAELPHMTEKALKGHRMSLFKEPWGLGAAMEI